MTDRAGSPAESNAAPVPPADPCRPATAAGRARAWLLHPLMPLLAMAVLATASLARKSATYDEPVLLTAGACYLRTFDPHVNPENPPLLKAVYALPTLVLGYRLPPPPTELRDSYRMNDGIRYGNDVLFSQAHPHLTLFACRLMVVAVALALGWVLFVVAGRIWAAPTPAILLWMYALSPNLLAHARLFTPDLGCTLFVFLSTVAAYRVLSRGLWRDVLLAGLALGGALLAKFTCVLLLPVLALQAALYLTLSRRWPEWPRVARHLLAVGVIALVLLNAFYGFSGLFRPLAGTDYHSPLVQRLQALPLVGRMPLPVAAAYVRGFDIVAHNNKPGFPAIFLGEIYPDGGSWWYYYLVALGLKEPIPMLVAVALGLVLLCRTAKPHWPAISVLALPPLVIFLNFSFVAFRQLGLRYILPLWPFLILLAGVTVDRVWREATRPARLAVIALGAWYVLASLAVFPDYLAYFNEFAGGSGNGWRYLAAADVDWGEDLPALARWQRCHGDPGMYVLYYGTAPLAAYGVKAVEWGTLPFPPYLALSVTNYYLCYRIPLVTFLRQERQPVARLGNSIHVFALDESVTREFIRRASQAAVPEKPEQPR